MFLTPAMALMRTRKKHPIATAMILENSPIPNIIMKEREYCQFGDRVDCSNNRVEQQPDFF